MLNIPRRKQTGTGDRGKIYARGCLKESLHSLLFIYVTEKRTIWRAVVTEHDTNKVGSLADERSTRKEKRGERTS